jgi:rRNA-processing protein FCF1
MALLIGRVIVVLAAAGGGLLLATSLGVGRPAGAAIGAAAGVLAVGLEVAAAAAPVRPLLWTAGGALGGLLAGLALGTALMPLAGGAGPVVRGAAGLLGAWVGGAVVARRAAALWTPPSAAPISPGRILDTSVLIDGRVADVLGAGFLDGPVVVPNFVVRELQGLADAGDPVRRNRGRRGFDVLDRLRDSSTVRLELVAIDFPEIAAVDDKLVALARLRGARLVTNDTALARVAAVAGVPVSSLNELAIALKPAVLPGEAMPVQVVREGKEPGQGVAYLDDGTMVVVEGGKRFIGQRLEVVVTSALQTSGGRMIFARPRDDETGARGA